MLRNGGETAGRYAVTSSPSLPRRFEERYKSISLRTFSSEIQNHIVSTQACCLFKENKGRIMAIIDVGGADSGRVENNCLMVAITILVMMID